ncbi:unnamed protein product, partial [Commensalibacter communis]
TSILYRHALPPGYLSGETKFLIRLYLVDEEMFFNFTLFYFYWPVELFLSFIASSMHFKITGSIQVRSLLSWVV